MSVPPVFVDLMIDGEWTQITGDVRQDTPLVIRRGRPDESHRGDPGKCPMSINNRQGRYSPRNPESPLFGKIGRNTPVRMGRGIPITGHGTLSDVDDSDQVAPSVNARGATSLLLCMWMTVFVVGDYTVPASMTEGTEIDGTFATSTTATEAVGSGQTGTRTAVFSDGSNGHAEISVAVPGDTGTPVTEESLSDVQTTGLPVTIRTADTTQAGWWLLAIQGWHSDPNNSMPDAPSGLTPGRWQLVADTAGASGNFPHIKAWMREVRQAGAQDVVFETDSSENPDNHCRVIVLSNVSFSDIRFVHEVSNWPQRWDLSDTDFWVPIETSGIIRRLGQGVKPIGSAIRRETMSSAKRSPRQYWPAEDGEGSRFIASAIEEAPPMRVVGVESADLASFDGFTGSAAIPVLNAARFFGDVPEYVVTGQTQIRWIMFVDPAGANDLQQIMTVRTDTGLQWEITYHTAGGGISAQVYGRDPDGDFVLLEDSGIFNFAVDGTLLRMALEVHQEGADIRYTVGKVEPGAPTGNSFGDQFITGQTMGRVLKLSFGEGRNLGNVAIGHISVHGEVTSIFDLGQALDGWIGERAGVRFDRLNAEEGVPSEINGDPADTAAMGPQRSDTLLNLLEECAVADGGILHETRSILGLTYRTRKTLYNQGHV